MLNYLNKSKIYILILLLTIVIVCFFFLSRANLASTGEWTKISSGSLVAEEVNDQWYMHSSSVVYLDILGAAGKERKLLSEDVFKVGSSESTLEIEEIDSLKNKLQLQNINEEGYQTLVANNLVFDTENPSGYIRLNDNRILVGDNMSENLWLVDSNGNEEPFLDNDGYSEAIHMIRTFGNQGEQSGILEWAHSPFVANDGQTILFHSNRDTITDNNYLLSVFSADINGGGKSKMILSSKEFDSNIMIIGTAGTRVVAYLHHKDAFLVHDLNTSENKTWNVNGHPISLSPDGKLLLFRKKHGVAVQPNLYLLNTTTGTEYFVGMPEGYFLNTKGAWSPDSTKYAFYLNGKEGNDPNNGWYRTNIKIGVVDVATNEIAIFDKPSEESNLYQLGHLSWYKNNTIIAYTDDNHTWALSLNLGSEYK